MCSMLNNLATYTHMLEIIFFTCFIQNKKLSCNITYLDSIMIYDMLELLRTSTTRKLTHSDGKNLWIDKGFKTVGIAPKSYTNRQFFSRSLFGYTQERMALLQSIVTVFLTIGQNLELYPSYFSVGIDVNNTLNFTIPTYESSLVQILVTPPNLLYPPFHFAGK